MSAHPPLPTSSSRRIGNRRKRAPPAATPFCTDLTIDFCAGVDPKFRADVVRWSSGAALERAKAADFGPHGRHSNHNENAADSPGNDCSDGAHECGQGTGLEAAKLIRCPDEQRIHGTHAATQIVWRKHL